MFRNFLSRVVKIFNIIIILKIKKNLSIIQCYYYYYYLGNKIPNILIILYRFISGLIILISFLQAHLSYGIWNVILDNYTIQLPNLNMVSNINDMGSESPRPLITSGFPIGTYTEAEFNRMKFEELRINFVSRKFAVPEGPLFFFERKPNVYIYPEKYHSFHKETISLNDNTLRIYTEKCLMYSYYTTIGNINDGYCIITYPDGTSIKVDDQQVVYNHLKYHKKNVFLNQDCYLEWYKQHFESFKNKSTINELVNTRKKITINELLNPVK